ncbi:coiled-coil domain-containing protein 137 [Latimeria chalumnae]|uniref:coiled-coil domain-containing protein 137 n=1 Tax=Latimeria chalumnae TaxID=7897 RepID=UPI0006D8ED62|nr:PREDICTED: coiled-coil domain-containing protein 137 [Latimeria chalumnae]|eukprot:XP_014350245.1 PREDICTED: coiled-coil domain-containing protein 137 [Latimeria chalumnae]
MGKHRKIKAVDPFYHGPRKDQQQKSGGQKQKYNMKPKNPDDQGIPYKLREIMKSKERMRSQKNKCKRKAEEKEASARGEPYQLQTDIPVPRFKRGKRESENAYIQRMDQESQHVLFLTRNQIERHPEMEEQQAVHVKSEKKKEHDRKRLEKLIKKREEKKEKRQELEYFKDTVQFGEVVMQPPALTAKPRKSSAKGKPGEKPLLLKTLLGSSSASPSQRPASVSMARQRIIQEERERVVKAYRDLKKLKQQPLSQTVVSVEKLKNPD